MSEAIGLIGVLLCAGLIKAFFAFPMQSAQDVAAWVQAIGSIGAIAGAVYVVRYQLDRQRRNDEVRKRDEQANLILAALVFGIEAYTNFEVIGRELGDGISFGRPAAITAYEGLSSIIDGHDLPPIWQMGAEEAKQFAYLRVIVRTSAAMLKSYIDHMDVNKNAVGSIFSSVWPSERLVDTLIQSKTSSMEAIEILRKRYESLSGQKSPI
jgi:hypothetical protein